MKKNKLNLTILDEPNTFSGFGGGLTRDGKLAYQEVEKVGVFKNLFKKIKNKLFGKLIQKVKNKIKFIQSNRFEKEIKKYKNYSVKEQLKIIEKQIEFIEKCNKERLLYDKNNKISEVLKLGKTKVQKIQELYRFYNNSHIEVIDFVNNWRKANEIHRENIIIQQHGTKFWEEKEKKPELKDYLDYYLDERIKEWEDEQKNNKNNLE